MRLTSRIAAATVLAAVGQSAAGQVEEILVVEKKQAGWIAWQTDLDTYCTKLLTTVDYGALPPGKPGGAGCFPGGNNPPTFIQIRFDRNQLTWHWAEPKPPSDRKWEAVRRYCPWPPLPSAWQVLDEPCLTAMNALGLDEHLVDDARGWREVLADPVGTRRAVAEAMDRPECRVPPSSDRSGETRSDLRGACAAEAMLRLASLQDKCVERLHTDWESLYTVSMPTVDRISDSQEEYYRLVESERQARAHNLWRTHMCRTVPPEAFEWIEALPVPPGDPTAHRWVGLPPITQALDLYAAARRFGLGIPERAIRQLKILAESAEREEKWREQLLAEPEIEWTF